MKTIECINQQTNNFIFYCWCSCNDRAWATSHLSFVCAAASVSVSVPVRVHLVMHGLIEMPNAVTIFVSNISSLLHADHLREVFKECGTILSLDYIVAQHQCRIVFGDETYAQAATYLNGTVIGDTAIQVQLIDAISHQDAKIHPARLSSDLVVSASSTISDHSKNHYKTTDDSTKSTDTVVSPNLAPKSNSISPMALIAASESKCEEGAQPSRDPCVDHKVEPLKHPADRPGEHSSSNVLASSPRTRVTRRRHRSPSYERYRGLSHSQDRTPTRSRSSSPERRSHSTHHDRHNRHRYGRTHSRSTAYSRHHSRHHSHSYHHHSRNHRSRNNSRSRSRSPIDSRSRRYPDRRHSPPTTNRRDDRNSHRYEDRRHRRNNGEGARGDHRSDRRKDANQQKFPINAHKDMLFDGFVWRPADSSLPFGGPLDHNRQYQN